jgi:hypothetical protein
VLFSSRIVTVYCLPLYHSVGAERWRCRSHRLTKNTDGSVSIWPILIKAISESAFALCKDLAAHQLQKHECCCAKYEFCRWLPFWQGSISMGIYMNWLHPPPTRLPFQPTPVTYIYENVKVCSYPVQCMPYNVTVLIQKQWCRAGHISAHYSVYVVCTCANVGHACHAWVVKGEAGVSTLGDASWYLPNHPEWKQVQKHGSVSMGQCARRCQTLVSVPAADGTAQVGPFFVHKLVFHNITV